MLSEWNTDRYYIKNIFKYTLPNANLYNENQGSQKVLTMCNKHTFKFCKHITVLWGTSKHANILGNFETINSHRYRIQIN